MKKVFRIFVLLVLMLSCFSLCGCEKLSTELSDMMIIQGIGIDKSREDVRVTVEILNNLQSGSANGEGNSPNKTYIFSSYGKTVNEAVNNIALKSGNIPLYAHNRVIVIGEEAAKSDISDTLDFFGRDYDSKPSMLICVGKNRKATDILSPDILQDTVKSEVVENILTVSSLNSFSPDVNLADAENRISNETVSLTLPAVEVHEKNGKKEYKLNGCAIFGNDKKLVSYLGKESTEGLLFLDDKVKKGEFSVEISKGNTASFFIVSSKTKYSVKTENGLPVFKVKIKTSLDLNELTGMNQKAIDKNILGELKKYAEKEIERKINKCFKDLKQYNCDAARLGKRLSLLDTKYYNTVKDDWMSVFSKSEIIPDIEVTVRRAGNKGLK